MGRFIVKWRISPTRSTGELSSRQFEHETERSLNGGEKFKPAKYPPIQQAREGPTVLLRSSGRDAVIRTQGRRKTSTESSNLSPDSNSLCGPYTGSENASLRKRENRPVVAGFSPHLESLHGDPSNKNRPISGDLLGS